MAAPLRRITEAIAELGDLHPDATRDMARRLSAVLPHWPGTDHERARLALIALLEGCAEAHEQACGCTRPP